MFRESQGKRGIGLKAIWPTPFPQPDSRASPPSDAKPCLSRSMPMMGNSLSPKMDHPIFEQLCLLEMETYSELKKKNLSPLSEFIRLQLPAFTASEDD